MIWVFCSSATNANYFIAPNSSGCLDSNVELNRLLSGFVLTGHHKNRTLLVLSSLLPFVATHRLP